MRRIGGDPLPQHPPDFAPGGVAGVQHPAHAVRRLPPQREPDRARRDRSGRPTRPAPARSDGHPRPAPHRLGNAQLIAGGDRVAGMQRRRIVSRRARRRCRPARNRCCSLRVCLGQDDDACRRLPARGRRADPATPLPMTRKSPAVVTVLSYQRSAARSCLRALGIDRPARIVPAGHCAVNSSRSRPSASTSPPHRPHPRSGSAKASLDQLPVAARGPPDRPPPLRRVQPGRLAAARRTAAAGARRRRRTDPASPTASATRTCSPCRASTTR